MRSEGWKNRKARRRRRRTTHGRFTRCCSQTTLLLLFLIIICPTMSSQSQSIPDEALHRLLVQIQTTLQTSSRQLSLVRAQTAAKQRERKGIELIRQGIAEETKDGQAQCWQGVGKMFVLEKPVNVDGTLAKQIKTVDEEIEALSKKAKVRDWSG